MSTFPHPSLSAARRRGVALVIVLSIIVLITALIVGFLLRAGTNRASTSSYSAKVSTRQLADMVVNLVQAQINDATGQGVTTAWASQPGAVRVFDNTGALKQIYRLYSSGTGMTTTGTADLANDVPPATWATSPATWVDLNAPITVQGVSQSGTGAVTAANALLSYPILDPRNPLSPGTSSAVNVLSSSKLPGFFLGTSNGTGTIPGTVTVPGATPLQPAPMPVRWMYVLKDGSIVPPAAGGNGNTVTITTASSSNPIVGRIAFWTDDESCKVNINTAAGSMSYRQDPSQGYAQDAILPAPWDTPRFAIWDEYRLFSQNQPVHNEFQRYPGHPASTDLYTIFSGTSASSPGGLGMSFISASANVYPYDGSANYTSSGSMAGTTASGTTAFFAMLPRYGDASSSFGGTADTTLSGSLSTAVTTTGTLPGRLYTSVGEFLYSTGTTTTGTSRSQNLVFGTTAVTRQQVETGKFFLTAHSDSPEVTLFGTPRIDMWPIDSDYGTTSPGPVVSNTTSLATPYDKLSAFCTTSASGAGIAQYYFQRHDSTSGTNDYINIPRNKQLYSYLQYLTSAQIPGFGGSFGAKYSTNGERDQILTEMVDYIRSTDVYDWGVSGTAPRFTPAYNANFNGNGQVVPLVIGATQGLGRMCTLSEVGMVMICTADGNSTLSGSYVPAVYLGGASGPKISTVQGSANDYRYVSNLPEAQYLLTGSLQTGLNAATGYVGQPTAAYTTSSTFPRNNVITTGAATQTFPANPTLANTYGGTLTPLQHGQKRVQAMLLFELMSPMEGFNQLYPDVQVKVSNLNTVSIGGQTPFAGTYSILDPIVNRTNTYNELGGYQQWTIAICRPNGAAGPNTRGNGWSGVINGGAMCPPFSPASNTASPHLYWFVSSPFTVPDDDTGAAQLSFGGGPFQIQLEATPKGGIVGTTTPVPVQTFNVTFPSTNTPVPDLMQYGMMLNSTSGGSTRYNFTSAADWWGFDNRISWACNVMAQGSSTLAVSYGGNSGSFLDSGCIIRADPPATNPTTTSGSWTYMTSEMIPNPYYKDPLGNGPAYANRSGVVGPQPSDVVRTLIAKDGDVRLVMAKNTVTADGATDMLPTAGYTSGTTRICDNFVSYGGSTRGAGSDLGGRLVPGGSYAVNQAPKVPSTFSGTKGPPNNLDWDTGQISSLDGAYANKPDEGNTYTGAGVSPYYNAGNLGTISPSNFTANRIIPSPVMFGSLPTGVTESIPWRTLQFRPIKTVSDAGATYNHDVRNDSTDPSDSYTLSGPPDHLLLDLFTMPVVEPYAISEPFSTAGKINMNYQILPFTYITRDTGVRAVLGSELIARVPLAATSYTSPSTQVNLYKGGAGSSAAPSTPAGSVSVARLPLNLDEYNGTSAQFSAKFASGDIFKSASEICDLYLVPRDSVANYAWPGFDKNWYGSDFALVGDNVRERPYAEIYPRLTTKSNTYTVHFKVQAIQASTLNPTQWNENSGAIKAEYRGSTTLERYVDPTDTNLPDYGDGTDPTAKTSIENFYKWRVISNNAFPP